jgi:hypothetical protein
LLDVEDPLQIRWLEDQPATSGEDFDPRPSRR